MKPVLRPCRERTRIWLYRDPVDFRKSHRGLAALVELELARSPFDFHTGHVVGWTRDVHQTTAFYNLLMDIWNIAYVSPRI